MRQIDVRCHRKTATTLLAATLVSGITFAAAPSQAGLIPGGPSTRGDCYIEFDIAGGGGSNRLTCVDGDPACDTDGQCGNGCTFSIKLCVNQSNVSGCTPAPFRMT